MPVRGSLDAVHAGHDDVRDDDVGPQPQGGLDECLAVAHYGHDIEGAAQKSAEHPCDTR